MILETARLRLEPFAIKHLDGLLVMNSDPKVRRYIPGPEATRESTEASIHRVQARWAQYGYSWWSFIERETGDLVGAGCIQHVANIPEHPLEIGWRLVPAKWGKGYASEAARAMAAFAFETVGTETLLAVAIPENMASRRVMERLGMRYRGLEPWYEEELATYELTQTEWRARQA
jgi:RimJ/RimL family protein N-acetyltransferase